MKKIDWKKLLCHVGKFIMLIAAMHALTYLGMFGCWINAGIVVFGLWKAVK